MISPCIEVRTNCRLHFGLTSLGHDPTRPQFGGVGVMVSPPGVHLELSRASEFSATGLLSDRVRRVAAAVAHHWGLPTLPDIRIQVVTSPREHTGLGVGSQLDLAVAAGLGEALGFPWRDPVRLAQLTSRGRRSAVGTHGFLVGGFIVDGGHHHNEPLGQLVYRGQIPPTWRFVLSTPRHRKSYAGAAEDKAFADVPPVPFEMESEMQALMHGEMIPALDHADHKRFSQAVYRYGELAGQAFATVQGGTYISREAADLIAWLRAQGITGVGQSSWGPTIFAITPDQPTGAELAQAIRARGGSELEVTEAAPANSGAVVLPCAE